MNGQSSTVFNEWVYCSLNVLAPTRKPDSRHVRLPEALEVASVNDLVRLRVGEGRVKLGQTRQSLVNGILGPVDKVERLLARLLLSCCFGSH